ncbi:innexin inx2-like [Diorhabda carinulata]|uniref:innexin inx2-like n=1 Tax=Diorhabda sublineata TaxID=1163346 RepID=UPI0024E10547|nr:innexin inx2-like [Diorhabda sublineata]XP_057666800.1 innexin inx2-like [Diorhabda carinulata]
MLELYKNVKTLIKLGTVHTDNNVFKLHYKVTVILLATFSVLLTSKQYFGEPIDCDVEQRKEVIDTYCWIHGTFIINQNLNDPVLPGLGIQRNDYPNDEPPTSRQTYYQWICLIFGVQAVLFYLPRYLWKACEAGRLKELIGEFGGAITSDKWNQMEKDKIVKHILDGTYVHNVYTFRYCFCEVLNLVNVILNICFMDWLITGQFSAYGIARATFKQVNPMDKVFPKIAKCSYYRYGPSGDQQLFDALCILPLNVLNEKVFLILWYWLFILLALTFLCILYRGLFLFLPMFRIYLLRAQARKLEKKKAKFIVSKLSFGNFFILYKFGKNVNPRLHKEVVMCLYDHLITRGSYKNFLQDI